MSLVVCSLLLALPSQDTRVPSLQELIKNVRASEKLYDNIDVSFRTDYRLISQKNNPVIASRHSAKTSRYVSKGDFARFECSHRSVDLQGNENNFDQLVTYDGSKTRIRQGDILNVREGKHVHSANAFRPHTILLDRYFVRVPLSVYLEGGEAVSKHPQAGAYKDHQVETTVLGYETMEGKKCIQVKILFYPLQNPELVSSLVVGIDPEKNYIPVKYTGYSDYLSKTVYMNTCCVTEWKEVDPGIWVPKKMARKANDSYELEKNGKVLVSNEDETKVESVTLTPNHDKSFYSNFPCKENDVYYELNPAGKIVKGGVLKSDGKGGVSIPSSANWVNYALLIAAVCFLILGGYLYKRF